MPTYRAPGVYVEETSFRPKAIEGVPTAVTAFVGPTSALPISRGDHPLITSFEEFEHVYGGLGDLPLADGAAPHHLAPAAHVFFAGGGRRLYVAPTPPGAAAQDYAAALAGLDALEDIELVAAPGAVAQAGATRAEIAQVLVDHVATRERRFAVLDPPRGLTVTEVRAFRANYDSRRAALYYPWVLAVDPQHAGRPILLPPSAFVCAAYARNDIERGLWAAPSSEVVAGAIGLETELGRPEQEVLAPLGVNGIRTFPGRGIRFWGARTISSDPEFRYVNVRRTLAYLEASLGRGLQWAVFEPNAPSLWATATQVVEDFLHVLWRSGALLGDKPEEAFFVRCDRSTMTQADLDAGRMVSLVGVALVQPAEFVVFRVSTKTSTTSA